MVGGLLTRQATSLTIITGQTPLCKLSIKKRQNLRRFERFKEDEQTRHDQPSYKFVAEKRSQ